MVVFDVKYDFNRTNLAILIGSDNTRARLKDDASWSDWKETVVIFVYSVAPRT